MRAGGDKHRARDLPALFANITIDNINSRIVFTRPRKLTACVRVSLTKVKKKEKERKTKEKKAAVKKSSQVDDWEEDLSSPLNTFDTILSI